MKNPSGCTLSDGRIPYTFLTNDENMTKISIEEADKLPPKGMDIRMNTALPLVTVVLATYNPPAQWLAEQLDSLNAQDYENLELLVLDDASPKLSLPELKEDIARHITRFPFQVFRNEKNLGSTKTFEKLTGMAGGQYISYCDQDDVWDSRKLSRSVEILQKTGAQLVCGDVRVIDGAGNKTADSILELRPRQTLARGENLAGILLFRNFVTGCTMMMDTKTAQEAVPFPDSMIHDQWLAISAAVKGGIEVYEGALMSYRIHGSNQTGVLTGIKTRRDYYKKRILPFYRQMAAVSERFPEEPLAPQALAWAQARKDYFTGRLSAAHQIFKYRRFNQPVALFEILLKFMPTFVFRRILQRLQSGTL